VTGEELQITKQYWIFVFDIMIHYIRIAEIQINKKFAVSLRL